MSVKKGITQEQFRQQVVREILSGQSTAGEARLRYGIASKSVIYSWIRLYEKYGCCSLLSLSEQPSEEVQDKSDIGNRDKPGEALKLEAQIRLLERQLSEQRLLSEMYSRMIDIAEKEYKIPVRKNFGTK